MNTIKKLYRSRHEVMIAGVAGGLGEYFKVDPTLIRVIFALLTILGGGGVLLYIILWIVMPLPPGEGAVVDLDAAETGAPDEPTEKPTSRHRRRGRFRFLFGLIVLLIGISAFLNLIRPLPYFRPDFIWPAVLIIIGAVLLSKGRKSV